MAAEEDSATVRALRVLDLLQRQPGLTAAELARRLGVSERAARRYIATLRQADIAVESTPGRYGGYRLGGGLRLPPLVFSSGEALELVMAVLDGQHAAADTDEPVGAALGKIIRALPRDIARQATLLREHAQAAPDRGSVRPDPTVTSRLVEAVAGRRRVRLTYRPRSGSSRTQVVDPWAVVVRYGHWYLLCLVHGLGAARTYRVDRVRDPELLAEVFVPPPDLDAVAWLERHLGRDREFTTRVRFEAPAAAVAPYVAPPMGDLEPLDGGAACMLVGTTSNPPMYASEWLAAIPHPFVVEGGPELHEAVAALAGRLADAVARRPAVPAPRGAGPRTP